MAAEEYGPQIKDPLQGRMSALNIVFFFFQKWQKPVSADINQAIVLFNCNENK
jgi:hypothetical protein